MAWDIEFPDCIIDVLKTRLLTIDGVELVLDRTLEPTDPNGAVGLTYEEWQPVEVEMGGTGGFDPSLSKYIVYVEHMVKHVSREEGNAAHRSVARAIRSMLYRDPETQQALRQLKHTAPGYIERLMKWELGQVFAANQIKNAFYFVSGTTIPFTTETV